MIKRVIKKLLAKIIPPKIVKANISVLSQSQLLEGKKAIVTGGTSGIGFEITRSFLNAGATVLFTGRSQDRINGAIERIIENNPIYKDRLFGLTMDINDIDHMEDSIKKAVELLGGSVDVLVNNAGIEGGNINNCTEEQFDAIINTNVKGAFFLSRVVARFMISKKIQGNILNICSSSSIRPVNSAYGVSKWAMRGLTEGLARMLAPHGIVVNGIAPGVTATPMLRKDSTNDDIRHPRSLMERYAIPEEIASMAVIMVSGMCRMVVGDILYMTGGSGIIYNDDENYSFN